MNSSFSKQTPVSRRLSEVFVDIPPSPLTQSQRKPGPHVLKGNLNMRTPSQVYVEIPASPLSISRKISSHAFLNKDSQKENTPLHTSHARVTSASKLSQSASSSIRKRKMSLSEAVADKNVSAKKPKLDCTIAANKKEKPVVDDSVKYPNGVVYCHQCNRKCDAQGQSLLC